MLKKLIILSQQIETMRSREEPTVLIVRKAPEGISNRKGRLGIFPASFNPPTKAHAALIKEARKQGDLDEILLLLDIQAMDKKPIGAAFEDRLIMLKKLFQRNPEVSIGLASHGLFVEKLKPLRELYPPTVTLTFIVGFDTILRVIDRKYYRNRKRSLDQLFRESQFLVGNRGDLGKAAFEMLFSRRKNKKYVDRVSFLTLPTKFSSLSSSLIREEISQGEPTEDLVPASVLRFIRKQGLYKSR